MELNSVAEKRSFNSMVWKLTLPLVAQNVINMLVNMADVAMLGRLSQTALAASSLANQVHFILSLVYFGLGTGASVLTSQYWGKGDMKAIQIVLGIALKLSMLVSLLFAVATWIAPGPLMRIFTDDLQLIEEGIVYLRVIGISYLFTGFSTMYLSVTRSIERVTLSTVVYLVSLAVNILLNALLIFGLMGFPKLGILGAAIATAVARAVELIICLVDSAVNKKFKLRISAIFEHHPALFRDFVRYAVPALLNDIVWGVGFSMYSVIMGRLGTGGDVVAANAIANVARNLAKIAASGFATSSAIVVGKALGANKIPEAKVYASRMLKLTFFTCFVGALIILASRPFVINYAELTDQARSYLSTMLYISAYYVFGQALNTTWVCGIFRAGGDVKFGFYMDIIDMWLFAVPLGLLAAFVWKLPVMVVYFLIFLDEFVKMPFVYYRYKQGKWLRNITRSDLDAESPPKAVEA